VLGMSACTCVKAVALLLFDVTTVVDMTLVSPFRGHNVAALWQPGTERNCPGPDYLSFTSLKETVRH
jgi:hypothetical protein